MAIEIERKFLVRGDAWRSGSTGPGQRMRQGYLADGPTTVRIRIAGTTAWLTIKGPVQGISRAEFEYPIPLDDAEKLLAGQSVTPVVEKIRHRIPHGGLVIELDEFLGENEGLLVAEVELPAENTPFLPPEWLGQEVTEDFRYHNSQLAQHPYKNWTVGG